MAEAFDTEQQLQGQASSRSAFVPRTGGNTYSKSASIVGGIGALADQLLPGLRDKELGKDIAKASESLIKTSATSNPVQFRIARQRMLSTLIAKHGASKGGQIMQSLFNGGPTQVDAEGNPTDAAGNFTGSSFNEVERRTLDQVAEIDVNYNNFAQRSDKVVQLLQKHDDANGTNFLDGATIQPIIAQLSRLPSDIDDIVDRYKVGVAQSLSTAQKQKARGDAQLELQNAILKSLNTFDNSNFRAIAEARAGGLTFRELQELPRTFINDVVDDLQRQGVFSALGINRQGLEEVLDAQVESITDFYTKGANLSLTELELHKNELALRNSIITLDNQMGLPPAIREMADNVQALQAVVHVQTILQGAMATQGEFSDRFGNLNNQLFDVIKRWADGKTTVASSVSAASAANAATPDNPNTTIDLLNVMADGLKMSPASIETVYDELSNNDANIRQSLSGDPEALANYERFKKQVEKQYSAYITQTSEEERSAFDGFMDAFSNQNEGTRKRR